MTEQTIVPPTDVLRGYLESPQLVLSRPAPTAIEARHRPTFQRQTTQVGAWLLGTGMTRVLPHRSGPANLLDFGDHRVVVDCGVGTTGRLLQLGVDSSTVTHIIITHLHLDHTLELASLLLSPWADRTRQEPPLVIGPPGTAKFVDRLLSAYDYDIRTRLPFGFSIGQLAPHVLEVEDGLQFDAADWKLHAFRVIHDPVDQAFGYRFDWDGGSVAFSGDTAPSENLIEACQGVDVLVHEALFPGYGFPTYHTTVDQLGEVATRAEAKHLVLTHLIPGHLPDEVWRARVARNFDGPITVGSDLLRLL